MPKYFIKTFGCQMNVSDSERIASFLESKGFVLAKKIENANLVVFNTCGVKQAAENRAYGMIHVLKKQATSNKRQVKIILTGCLANRPDVRKRLSGKIDLFTDIKNFPNNVSRILYIVSRMNFESKIQNTKYEIRDTKNFSCKEKISYLSIKAKHTSKYQAFVPVMTGCNNFCSYCVVPYARDREVSRPLKDIFLEVNNLARKKYKEIVLLGQNVNSYKNPLPTPSPYLGRGWREAPGEGINFPKLLDFLAKKFPTVNFKFLTSHPKDFSDELIEVIAKNKNISREIHLPIQSGSSKILKAMNRPYTQKHYLDLIKKARKIIPDVKFTTDIIVGFPGETEKDFQESVKVFKKVGYSEAYINKYSPRPGTAAFHLGDPIPQEEKKRREKILRKIICIK